MRPLEICIGGITARLIIRHATIGDAMRRGILAAKAADSEYQNEAEQAVAIMIYPRCVACADGEIEQDGTITAAVTLTPSEFCSLPYEIGEAWLQAVIEENPGWALQPVEEPDAEKKD